MTDQNSLRCCKLIEFGWVIFFRRSLQFFVSSRGRDYACTCCQDIQSTLKERPEKEFEETIKSEEKNEFNPPSGRWNRKGVFIL